MLRISALTRLNASALAKQLFRSPSVPYVADIRFSISIRLTALSALQTAPISISRLRCVRRLVPELQSCLICVARTHARSATAIILSRYELSCATPFEAYATKVKHNNTTRKTMASPHTTLNNSIDTLLHKCFPLIIDQNQNGRWIG